MADAITRFTPPALTAQADPPKFFLRTIERPHVEYQHALASEGLGFHPIEEMRAETLRALEELWPKRTYKQEVARIAAMWERLDAGETLAAEEQAALDGLGDRLATAWPRIGEMAADNARFGREAGRVAASLAIVDWHGLDIRFQREAGRVPLAVLDEVEASIGPVAWVQLATACIARLRPKIPENRGGEDAI